MDCKDNSRGENEFNRLVMYVEESLTQEDQKSSLIRMKKALKKWLGLNATAVVQPAEFR